MGRPLECAELIREGFMPTEIAKELGIAFSSTSQYLMVAVGLGLLRLSEIALTVPGDIRSSIESVVSELETDDYRIVGPELSAYSVEIRGGDLQLYLLFRGSLIGDLYFYVSDLERSLHSLIQRILQAAYSGSGGNWWNLAVSKWVRSDCEKRRWNDKDTPGDPYSYTTFRNLKDILEDNWGTFAEHLPEAEAGRKRELLHDLDQAARVRNRVMHPIGGGIPSEADFQLVRGLRERLSGRLWRDLPR